jgi:hypothetical protein
MPRQTIMTHNPFSQAKGMPDKTPRVEARFEIRARVQTQIESVDRDIQQAIRAHRLDLIESLTLTRNRLIRELP